MALPTDLTELPTDVMVKILSFLRTRDAIRFSIVCKKWFFLWKKISNITILASDFTRVREDELPAAIENVIFAHDENINALELELGLKSNVIPKVREWIVFCGHKDVKNVMIRIGEASEGSDRDIGDSLMECLSVENLDISGVSLRSIQTHVVFHHLTSCRLSNILLNDQVLHNFVGLCPRLHKLEIQQCLGLRNFTVVSSSIENLYVEYLRGVGPKFSILCENLKCLKLSRCALSLVNGAIGPQSITKLGFMDLCIWWDLPLTNSVFCTVISLTKFQDLQTLIIHGDCFLNCKLPDREQNTIGLPKLKKAYIHFSGLFFQRSKNTLKFILNNCPEISKIHVFMPLRHFQIEVMQLVAEYSALLFFHCKWVTEATLSTVCENLFAGKHKITEEEFSFENQRKKIDRDEMAKVECIEAKCKAQLDESKLRVVQIAADGNCMFRALADQLCGDQEQHQSYRQMVVDYMIAHPQDFTGFIEDVNPNIQKYCQNMAKDGTWGGHLELQAAARRFVTNIHIHEFKEKGINVVPIKPFEGANEHTIHLSYHYGSHYNSLHSKTDDD